MHTSCCCTLRKKMECESYFYSRLFVYVGTIVAKVKAECTTTTTTVLLPIQTSGQFGGISIVAGWWWWWWWCACILLIDLLINFYAIAIVIIVFVVVSACQCLLWYREWYCGQCRPTTIATIHKVTLWFISQRLFPIKVYLNCFTTTANSIGEIVGIFKLCYIH